jgi:molybdopterin converting factor small subunit
MENQIFVRVGKFPGAVTEYTVERGTSVSALLQLARLSVGSQEAVEINGSRGSMSSTLSDGDTISIIPNIKGNL